MALNDITRPAVLQAIDEFRQIGRDAFLSKYGIGPSRGYDLEFEGALYDSKAIVGAAHGYSGGRRRPLRYNEFSGGAATVERLLRNLGFSVVRVGLQEVNEATSSEDSSQFWWVNNGQTFAHEVDGNYLWSPTKLSNGGRSQFYDNMTRIQAGDIVFAFAGGEIRAVGVCTAPVVLAPRPAEFGPIGEAWGREGWRVPVEFTRLSRGLRPKNHMDQLGPTLSDRYSPIRADGNGNQGAYLAALPSEMADTLIGLLGQQWAELNVPLSRGERSEGAPAQAADDLVEREIHNRTDLPETERLQLVKARRGQGIYRQNLERFENACRVTGARHSRHLRASHIKPWRVCTTFEKLDGNNGLLLSPHVDHLFDQGFISFSDDGRLLVSATADPETLDVWGIDLNGSYGPFRPEQLPYLEFHRDVVFQQG